MFYYSMSSCFLWRQLKNVKNSNFCSIPLNPHSCSLLPLSSPLSHFLPSLPVDSPTTPQHRLTDATLTDLLPSSFHWPPAWQQRFNAGLPLAKAWQVNLWLCCDLMPPAFEVSYSSVAYRTQKRCQVAIVKSYPWREVAVEYNSPYVTGGEKTFLCKQRRNRAMWRENSARFPSKNTSQYILLKLKGFRQLCHRDGGKRRERRGWKNSHTYVHLGFHDWRMFCLKQQQCSCYTAIYLRSISSSAWQSILTRSRRARMWPCNSLDPWKSLRVNSTAAPAPVYQRRVNSRTVSLGYQIPLLTFSHHTWGHLLERKIVRKWRDDGKPYRPALSGGDCIIPWKTSLWTCEKVGVTQRVLDSVPCKRKKTG